MFGTREGSIFSYDYAYVPMTNGVTRETNTTGTCIDSLWSNHNEFNSGIFQLQLIDNYSIFGLLTSVDNNVEFITKSFRDHSQLFYRINSDHLEHSSQLFIKLIYNLYNKCCPIRSKKISRKKPGETLDNENS